MLGKYLTNDLIRKYTVIFGSLFDDIYLKRDDVDNTEKQKIKVPLRYGPKDKTLVRRLNQEELEKPFAEERPAMAFEFMDIQYDPNRNFQLLNKIKCNGNFVYNPVPYDIFYNLYIAVKNETDGLRIIEQIIPFFKPQFSVPMKVIETLGIKNDVTIGLNSIQKSDGWEGSNMDRREIIWTLTFTLKGYIYGTVEEGKVIKKVEANILDGLARIETIEVTGGQTANGMATATRPPSVDWTLVDPSLPYTFITDII